VGPVTARALLSAFGLPGTIFCAGFDALQRVVASPVARALAGPIPASTQALIERTLAWLQRPGHHLLTLADAAYPRVLLEIADPPPLLYLKGRLDLLTRPALAVVGSRNASAQGVANAEHFSQALSEAGLTIVSGLALGIDAAAHRGSLRGVGSTIAVIGTGIDIVYPCSNRALALLIAEQGCIVSEYALATPALPANFPRRNRLISGLARAVLVIEAAARSGSLITARMAAEQGRDVFAIPGSIHSALAKGCHALIKQGAKLVESADDVLVEMPAFWSAAAPAGSVDEASASTPANAAPVDTAPVDTAPVDTAPVHTVSMHAAPAVPLDAQLQALLTVLGHDPVDLDSLAQRAGLDAAGIIAKLLTLELGGLVERLPGGLFQRSYKDR
jgi:DNA processing protein